MGGGDRRILIVGGSFSGLCCARDLRNHFLVTIVDAKEYFEYTPGILRAYVKPKHFDALSFTLAPVIETAMGCKYIWGEVKKINGDEKTAVIKPIFADVEETIDFDFCLITSGCNFGPFHKHGESLWFPTIHEAARPEGSWGHFDERFIEGRRRHILEEYSSICKLNEQKASVLVIGAGFIGVEWATELRHYFQNLSITIIDMLPHCLGPLPEKAAAYCERKMKEQKINQYYKIKYDPNDPNFWPKIGLTGAPDKRYICIGVKASNYFMPPETLSEKGPGGGGWILMDMTLAVKTRDGKRWGADAKGEGRIYAIGDCNYGCVEPDNKELMSDMSKWPCAPIPKISYPGEEEAVIACRQIEKIEKRQYLGKIDGCCWGDLETHNMHWPWGAGMFATSLGPHDACFVMGANYKKGSGYLTLWGSLSVVQKEIIEASKTNECRFGLIGRLIWHFVHHTPVHLFGGGPLFGY